MAACGQSDQNVKKICCYHTKAAWPKRDQFKEKIDIPHFSDYRAHRTIRRSINKSLLTRLLSYIKRSGL